MDSGQRRSEAVQVLVLVGWMTAIAGCGEDASDTPRSGAEASVHLEMDPFRVPPGSEGLMCQTFANPFAADVDIVEWAAKLDDGGHHLIVFDVPDPDASPAASCPPNDGQHPMVFQGQSAGLAELRYPAGTAARLAADHGLTLQVHYNNPTDHELEIRNSVTVVRASAQNESIHVASLKFENFAISVPPGGVPTDVSKTCRLQDDVEIVWLTSHMHSHGVGFRAVSGEASLFETNDWHDPPLSVMDPPERLAAGSEVTFSCTYVNGSAQPVGFGLSLDDDEMCVLVGAYTRSDGADGPVLECDGEAGGGCLDCFQALVQQKPELACTDDGPPSSRERYQALDDCTCGEQASGCREACLESVCAGQMPDDACAACLDTSCAPESAACIQGA